MNYKLAKLRKFSALFGAIALLVFVPRAAFADFTNVWVLDVVTNYAGSDYPAGINYNTRHTLIQANARWGILPNATTNISGQNVPNNGPYLVINFLTMINYYVPNAISLNLTNDSWNTNLYIPYTNTLSVTVAGPAGMPSPVYWNVTSPSEWTNSSAYSVSPFAGNYDLVPIPTGQYTIAFSNLTGYTSPSSVTTNITGDSPVTNSITGTYARVCGTITVTNVSPTNGWWTITAPADFATYSSSALSGTNNAVLTNAPVGMYTTTWGALAGYATPASTTQASTVSSPDLTFSVTYLPNDNFTLMVDLQDDAAASAGARWQVDSDGTWRLRTDSKSVSTHISHYVDYLRIKDWYQPTRDSFSSTTNLTLTKTYLPYTNSLSVVIAGITDGSTSTWQIAQFTDFTNSSAYKAMYTNSQDLASIPTGSYAISFNDVFGYTKPASNTINITGALTPTVVGTYTRNVGTIIVTNSETSPTNISWEFTTYPMDFATYSSSALSGIGVATLTNAPVGLYTIHWRAVVGYDPPVPPTETQTNSSLATTTFVGNYGYGWRLTVHVITISDTNLNGLGTGTVVISPTNAGVFDGIESWYFSTEPSREITITAIPATNTGYKSFFFKWAGDIAAMTPGALVNPITGSMDRNRNIQLYFSRAWNTNDNVGDIDGDGLPDQWERDNGLDPMSIKGDNGAQGNPDGDFIPKWSATPPMGARTEGNLTLINENGAAAYPLDHDRLIEPGMPSYQYTVNNFGYATGDPFYNIYECRGLDGLYGTGDDPGTDPKAYDTQNDEVSDGWKYYFWYWRSAESLVQGVTNSAGFTWVEISPLIPLLIDDDTDKDLRSDNTEFKEGTDPTHCDTDGDGMDDYWEVNMITPSAVSNALDSANWDRNPDGDFYATVANQFVLTAGMAGTAFTNAVCFVGVIHSPSGVWEDKYINNGSNVFDLYQDTIIKATAALANRQTGTNYTNTVYYGTATNLGDFQQSYPVWVDVDNSGNYSAGDIAIINPPVKHDAVYVMAPATPGPGVCSFSPKTAWTNMVAAGTNEPEAAPNTAAYITYQEYLSGDYLGRLSWNAGGLMVTNNDVSVTNRNSYTRPDFQDSEDVGIGDEMPDGWELYVGLNPNYAGDAIGDGDGDKLVNRDEWANSTHPLRNCGGTWANKFWPTDPGVLLAPSPNDPHPMDTDWDGVTDNAEKGALNPDSFDTDNDMLPDGWELYAGSSAITNDAEADLDGDGLPNWREYLTGAVPEFMYCDARWNNTNINFMCRPCMAWDPQVKSDGQPFIPPDFLTCPSFMFANNVSTNLADLRANYPAAVALGYVEYHTTLANDNDSDWDGMDDFWEVYHGLNPCKGVLSLMIPVNPDDPIRPKRYWWQRSLAPLDAGNNADAHNFQVGTPGVPFTSLSQLVDYLGTTNLMDRADNVTNMVGPFNSGLILTDLDADGLPNQNEYSYNSDLSYYHTDPSPFWRTDMFDENSFVSRNYYSGYTFEYTFAGVTSVYHYGGSMHSGGFADNFDNSAFPFEGSEGFDTDHDGRGDYGELNSSVGETGDDPLDPRNPIRNRVLLLNGTNDFARTMAAWGIGSESYLTKFCAEAWIKPDNPLRAGEQIIIERASLCPDPDGPLSANFKLGIVNGLPFITYNGRGAMRGVYQAKASMSHQIQPGTNWTHIAGVYDGTNLMIYVNGENSMSIHAGETPDNGIEGLAGSTLVYRASSVIIGAEETNPSAGYNSYAPRSFFDGCIDEVRVWNGPRSQAEIIANKGRRLSRDEVASLPLFVYCTFDDVPDPYHRNSDGVLDEPVAPNYMTVLDTSMKLHPTITWWRDCVNRSTVYTGVNGSYNYIAYAQNHADHVARVPPFDDFVHTNALTNSSSFLPDDYKNPANPYGAQNTGGRQDKTPILTDFYLFLGARSVATNSWLTGLDPGNPDATDSDGDCLPDWWEQLYGLNPEDDTGDNGKWGDPDHDGLSNFAEYQAGTDPLNSETYGTGVGDYDYPRGVYSRTYGEMYTDGDGMPDVWEDQYGLDPQKDDANLDLDGDGWSNYQEFIGGTDPSSSSSYPTPAVSGTVHYYGTNFVALTTARVRGLPSTNMITPLNHAAGQVACDALGNFSLTGLHEGAFRLFGYLDLNNDNSWTGNNVGETYSTEPAGQGEDPGQFFYMNATPCSGFRVGISDNQPGYSRAVLSDNTTSASWDALYHLVFSKISQSGAPTVLDKWKTGPSFGEWDFQMAGIYGLAAGTYRWYALGLPADRHGVFAVNWPSSPTKPTLISPLGGNFYYARGALAWNMDFYSTRYRLQIERRAANGSYNSVLDTYYPVPYRDNDGYFRDELPMYLNDLPNGVYRWRVAGWNPRSESALSDWSTFTVNLSATYSYSVSGDIYYFGKVPATRIIVEAFDNRGFSGKPAARMTLTPPASASVVKCSYTLYGLQQGNYYVRAFLDVSPVGGTGPSGRLDYWSSFGFYRDQDNFYQPGVVNLTGAQVVNGANIIIRDRDTDNDDLPDAWEMAYFGNLNQTGEMDFDGDGETNLEEYIKDGVNQNPSSWDTDGDGLSDGFESHYNGAVFGFARRITSVGSELNPNMRDTDGDGYSDGAELLRYHTDPLRYDSGDPETYPTYRPLCTDAWASPGDYDGDGRSDIGIYDYNAGIWRVFTMNVGYFECPFGSAQTPMAGDYDGDGLSLPMVGDYDGDGRTDFSFYDKGLWTIYFTQSGRQPVAGGFGDASMVPVQGDYDGDGHTELGVYDTDSSYWYIYNLWSGRLDVRSFGAPGMIPVPGDYNGDGAVDYALYAPATGNWMIGCAHKYYGTWSVSSGGLGGPGWMPVPGDYDGDGRSDYCLFNESTGGWIIYTTTGQSAQGGFGWAGCVPVPGDYDGDGRTDLAIYDTNTGAWYIYCWSGASYAGGFGGPGSSPILKGRF
ncbi:MAG: hypothetical protein PHW60_02520 [Kiritimatiellae bacterium]|nr:hypothetical protein [Kiritimatiellia bacterium]